MNNNHIPIFILLFTFLFIGGMRLGRHLEREKITQPRDYQIELTTEKVIIYDHDKVVDILPLDTTHVLGTIILNDNK